MAAAESFLLNSNAISSTLRRKWKSFKFIQFHPSPWNAQNSPKSKWNEFTFHDEEIWDGSSPSDVIYRRELGRRFSLFGDGSFELVIGLLSPAARRMRSTAARNCGASLRLSCFVCFFLRRRRRTMAGRWWRRRGGAARFIAREMPRIPPVRPVNDDRKQRRRPWTPRRRFQSADWLSRPLGEKFDQFQTLSTQ